MSPDDPRSPLVHLLQAYQGINPQEERMRAEMLAFVQRAPNCFSRDLAEGHMTASAMVVNADHSAVVLMLHRKLGLWLQPGGHADGETDLLAVARKEVAEETGLRTRAVSTAIFDVDIHEIPANRKTPAHFHYDVRFLLAAEPGQSLQSNNESRALEWVPVADVPARNSDVSVTRMAEKLMSPKG